MCDIVLIDDEALLLNAVKARLEHLGHTVRVAENGNAGLEAVAEAPPDLVVTDIIMPEREGIETLMELRRSHPGVKVIVMSGGGRGRKMDFLHAAEKLGADAVLAKPFTARRLQETIDDVLARAA